MTPPTAVRTFGRMHHTALPPSTSQASPHQPSPDHPSLLPPVDGPARITVRPWWDPQLAATGHPSRSEYAERYWLGVVGPSTLLLLRRFARGFDEFPGGFHIDVAETARALGLGRGTGRNAPLQRSIDRACTFGLARRVGPERGAGAHPVVEVRLHLPHLAPHQLARLPESVRRSHDAWSAPGRAG